MLIVQGTEEGRTKEQGLFRPVPTLTEVLGSDNNRDTPGRLHHALCQSGCLRSLLYCCHAWRNISPCTWFCSCRALDWPRQRLRMYQSALAASSLPLLRFCSIRAASISCWMRSTWAARLWYCSSIARYLSTSATNPQLLVGSWSKARRRAAKVVPLPTNAERNQMGSAPGGWSSSSL